MNNDKILTQGESQTPYDEITLTIPAGGYDRANIALSYFRLLALTGSGLKVRFGQSGSFSSIIGAGIGVELPQAVTLVEFQNTSGADVTFTVGYSMGRINDDRLTVSGVVSVTASNALPVNPMGTAAANTVNTVTTVAASLSGSTATMCARQIKNVGAATVYIGPFGVTLANGYPLEPNETMQIYSSGAIWALTAAGTSVVRGIYYTKP